MNILFYVPHLRTESGGVWQYSNALLKILAGDRSHAYFIYHNFSEAESQELEEAYPHMNFLTDKTNLSNNNPVFNFFKRVVNKTSRIIIQRNVLRVLPRIDQISRRFKIDVIHCPFQFIPVVKDVKLITTMHDVQELHFPEYFTAEERAYRATAYMDFLKRADGIVVSYEHIKADLIKFFDTDEKKIKVILLDMQKLWFEKFTETDNVNLTKKGIPEKFLLYPAATWKHKNHLGLLQAILHAREVHGAEIQLVCTGGQNANYPVLQKFIIDNGLENQVRFEGIVSEEILYSLYKKCRAVVVPTLYEAGSFPLIESILLERPVICSNVTSLPETMGSGQFIFDPKNIGEMSSLMVRIWTDDSFLNDNLLHIRGRIESVKQHNSFEKLMDLYSSVANDIS